MKRLVKFFTNHDFNDGDFKLYDKNGNKIYHETSDGYWYKVKFDDSDNETYFEDSHGTWNKRKYDENHNMIYSRYTDGRWWKREFDGDSNVIYHENSTEGVIFDNRSSGGKAVEIDGKKYQLKEIQDEFSQIF